MDYPDVSKHLIANFDITETEREKQILEYLSSEQVLNHNHPNFFFLVGGGGGELYLML